MNLHHEFRIEVGSLKCWNYWKWNYWKMATVNRQRTLITLDLMTRAAQGTIVDLGLPRNQQQKIGPTTGHWLLRMPRAIDLDRHRVTVTAKGPCNYQCMATCRYNYKRSFSFYYYLRKNPTISSWFWKTSSQFRMGCKVRHRRTHRRNFCMDGFPNFNKYGNVYFLPWPQ